MDYRVKSPRCAGVITGSYYFELKALLLKNGKSMWLSRRTGTGHFEGTGLSLLKKALDVIPQLLKQRKYRAIAIYREPQCFCACLAVLIYLDLR